MSAIAERSMSIWTRTATLPDRAPLEHDAEADVVVVGAGIAGLSTAYELARAGRTVIVLDRGPVGGGMTGRSTAHPTSAIDDHCAELIKVRRLDAARLLAAVASEGCAPRGRRQLGRMRGNGGTGSTLVARDLAPGGTRVRTPR